jgi:hypothetical protein
VNIADEAFALVRDRRTHINPRPKATCCHRHQRNRYCEHALQRTADVGRESQRSAGQSPVFPSAINFSWSLPRRLFGATATRVSPPPDVCVNRAAKDKPEAQATLSLAFHRHDLFPRFLSRGSSPGRLQWDGRLDLIAGNEKGVYDDDSILSVYFNQGNDGPGHALSNWQQSG